MKTSLKNKITVLAFDGGVFDRKKLNKMPDRKLYELCFSSRDKGINVLYWKGLDIFQLAVNGGLINIDNYWIYFIDMNEI